MSVKNALEKFVYASEVPEALVKEMESAATTVRLNRGTYFVHAGDACKGVALLSEGDIRVFKTGPTGREITLYHVEPGQTCLLTLNGALTGEAYPAHAIVEADVEAVVLPVASFRKWVDRDTDFRRFIFRSMAERIGDLMGLFDEVAFGRMDRRLAEFLDRAFADGSGGGKTLQITHDQIAAELGSAREVISRILKDFERQGILALGRGRLELKDRKALQELVLRR